MDDLQHTTNKHTLIEDFTETGKIYSDKDRISQVITNLISNAIKYSPHSDKIVVSTKLENGDGNSLCTGFWNRDTQAIRPIRYLSSFIASAGINSTHSPVWGWGCTFHRKL